MLERLEAEVVTADEVAGSSFADLGLGARITEALAELGATEPFPIQAATIPTALEGVPRDVAETAMALAAAKLGVKTKFVAREDARVEGAAAAAGEAK